jgi:quinoprotein glucose dehydrogenase
MPPANPPRLFGGLLFLLGLVLAGGGLHLNINYGGGGSYFLVVGLLIAASGALLFLGRSSALVVYGVALATVWIWSFRDVGANLPELLPRVALPTLVALYVFSSKIRPRLS